MFLFLSENDDNSNATIALTTIDYISNGKLIVTDLPQVAKQAQVLNDNYSSARFTASSPSISTTQTAYSTDATPTTTSTATSITTLGPSGCMITYTTVTTCGRVCYNANHDYACDNSTSITNFSSSDRYGY
ncbi:unnamed protein product [Adineta ricciae]|uniref:Uncharacterized protein n=1 Tax=Adineta ricciae TaxID=249248 RepID=A0A816G7M5_ADIRI|nr:unnamed protein product [Adineta ricciae]